MYITVHLNCTYLYRILSNPLNLCVFLLYISVHYCCICIVQHCTELFQGTKMELSKQIRFDLDDELYQRVKAQENCSEFIRVAIEEKLSRKKSDDNEILKILRQMDRLDSNAIHADVKSLIIAVGTVFEATQKQKRL